MLRIQTLDGGVPDVEQMVGGGCGDRVVDVDGLLNAIGWDGFFSGARSLGSTGLLLVPG